MRYRLLLALLVGIPGPSCEGDPVDDVTPPARRGLAVDGLLLLDHLGDHLLLDPATGKLGPALTPRFALSPDLTSVLQAEPFRVTIATFERDADGTPTLTSTATLDQAAGNEAAPGFNAQGDRVSGVIGWWNLETNEHLPFAGAATSPDGRHHVGSSGLGDGVGLLYDDMQPVMLAGEPHFTSDGQWLVGVESNLRLHFSMTHVPTHTQVLPSAFPLPVDALSSLRVPYAGSDPRGRLLFMQGGRRGLLIPATCGTPAKLEGPIAPITQLVPAHLVEDTATPIETPLDALNALPKERDADGEPYDGFEWSVLAITPDAKAVLIEHHWYDLVRTESPGCAVYTYSRRTLDIYRVELGGSGALVPQVRLREADHPDAGSAIANGCAPLEDPAEPLASRHQRTIGVQFLSETDWLCVAKDGAVAAFVEGVGRALPAPGVWATLDRSSLLGPAPAAGAADVYNGAVTTGLCQGPLAGGVDACILPPDLWWSRNVVAQVGIGLVPRSSTGPVVTALSHRAATPGTVVRVLGYGFGASGELKVGDTTIAAVERWSDRAIDFVMPDDAPDIARVTVVDATGRASTQRHLWLGKSEPWANMPRVPDGPFELRQGVNRITFPGAGDYTVGIRSTSQILPGGDLPEVPEDVGPDHADAVVAKAHDARITYPWITFRSERGVVFRPLVMKAGLVPDGAWHPVGDVVGVHADNRFVASADSLILWQRNSASGSVAAPAADADWSMAAVSGTSGLVYRDGEDIWRVVAGNLERVTSWHESDGVRTPVFTPEITTPFVQPITAFAVHGDLVVIATQDIINAQAYGTLHVSSDRGGHFTEAIAATRNLWTTWGPVVAGQGLYGSVSGPDEAGAMVERIARVTLAGELEVDATLPRTPGGEIQCHGGYLAFARWLLCHDEPRHRLYAAEVGVDGATWEEVGGALAGHIASLFVSDDGALLVGSDVGGIWESVDRVAWTQRDQLTFGPASMPLVVHALGRLPDGAMVALAQHASWSNARVLVRPAQ